MTTSLDTLLPGGKGVWIPIDHGITAYPEPGLNRMDALIPALIAGGADAIVAQKGIVADWVGRTNFNGFVAHLSVSTVHGGQEASTKVLVGTAAAAQRRGAVAVSAQVNLGTHGSSGMIEDLGRLTDEAHDLGIPVLGMIYPRGQHLVDVPGDRSNGAAHAARLAYELGCSVVKVPWTGDKDSFTQVVEAVPIPVLIAGGTPDRPFLETLNTVAEALKAGAAGVCMGRAVFTSPDPERSVRALVRLIHEGATPPAAWG